ncbi:MAG: GH3 auxin-responsive promoter family protein [Bacteroidia bacterium]|nr:GH3 auxin-responsive promoter family protein [Bacteroidia bacterium]
MSKPRDFLGQLFHRGRNISDILTFNRAKAVKWQEKTLKKMLYHARKTEFGQKYGFEKILISPNVVESFCANVPIGNYSSMHEWWQREYSGESNITWPGRPKYFALSSGTTEGSSKYIPVTDDGLKAILRASRRQLFTVFKTDVPKDFFTKDYLMISGSTDLNFNGLSYSGDLSGITTANVPLWFERFAIPGEEIKKQRDWNKKLELLVDSAPQWDVVMMAGAPAWIKMLLEKIIERYSLDNIHQLWPNFSVYLWGAVSISPYKNQLDAMMAHPIKYFETYLASEGFVAFQTKPEAEGMRLVLRNNTFFEFVPFTDDNFTETGELKPEAKAVQLAQVVQGVDYAVLITTSAGAWRYMIGDTVKFVNTESCEIKITGRTRQYLSLCGEHLSVDNMNDAVARTAAEFGVQISEYTVKGYKDNGKMGHHWFLACDKNDLDAEKVRASLDAHLGSLNDDYAVERKHVLTGMKLELYPESVFLGWMEKNGKLGGQSKFPRVMADTQFNDWTAYLQQISNANHETHSH